MSGPIADPWPEASVAPTAPTGPDAALAAERALLLVAIRALSAGDLPRAEQAIADHRARFPRGRLAKERAVLRVRWLLRVGRPAEARRVADRFRAEHPDSLLRHALDRLLPGPLTDGAQ